MKVILKEDVKDLGLMGSIVDVKKGYGRNYLIPRNLAVEANPNNIKQFEHQKKIILAKARKIRQSAQDIADQISQMSLAIEALAGEEDKLFGSVTAKDIAEAIARQGVEVDRRKILLEEPIKRLGTYEVGVKIHQDVTATVKVEVTKARAEQV
ncbi:MAG: 50S ribosomal protein L9 [Nitrospiraceae bacterium]|nr:MAG: 50S ribosomal protein L9 [Nitrospiraceae bacterium]